MPEDITDQVFFANGVNGSTGDYGFAPIGNAEFGQVIAAEGDPDNRAALKTRNQQSALMLEILQERLEELERELGQVQDEAQGGAITRKLELIRREIKEREHLGVVEGVEGDKLDQAGWGLIFASDADHGPILEAMSDLVRYRQGEAGERFACFAGEEKGYQPGESYLDFLARHVTGDWGELDDEDKAQNDFSVKNNLRILSAYTLQTGERIWLITESDRSATTILLPSEY